MNKSRRYTVNGFLFKATLHQRRGRNVWTVWCQGLGMEFDYWRLARTWIDEVAGFR